MHKLQSHQPISSPTGLSPLYSSGPTECCLWDDEVDDEGLFAAVLLAGLLFGRDLLWLLMAVVVVDDVVELVASFCANTGSPLVVSSFIITYTV